VDVGVAAAVKAAALRQRQRQQRCHSSLAHVAERAAQDLSVAFRNVVATPVVSRPGELGAKDGSGADRRVFGQG